MLVNAKGGDTQTDEKEKKFVGVTVRSTFALIFDGLPFLTNSTDNNIGESRGEDEGSK
jgi:hypothetical protein